VKTNLKGGFPDKGLWVCTDSWIYQSLIKMASNLYMRHLSQNIREFRFGAETMIEDPIVNVSSSRRPLVVMMCRNRSRVISQAWKRWIDNGFASDEAPHDYVYDIRACLSRRILPTIMRSELEIESIYKWAIYNADKDPTGIAHILVSSKSRKAVVNTIQHMRLETFDYNETILFQGTLPKPEDGHFTVLSGVTKVVAFPRESMKLLLLQEFYKLHSYDDANLLNQSANNIAFLHAPTGFGELSTLAHAKRTASIIAGGQEGDICEIIVIPADCLMSLIQSKSKGNIDCSEAVDFLRQSGLANRINPQDLIDFASSMEKITLRTGDILHLKNEPCEKIYLVVAGEVLCDTESSKASTTSKGSSPIKEVINTRPFVASQMDNCYILKGASIIGEEALIGNQRKYGATAAIVSEAAILFEITGFGIQFLMNRLGLERYCALSYKDLKLWGPEFPEAESKTIQIYFDSLRKAVSRRFPSRGLFSQKLEVDEVAHSQYFHDALMKDFSDSKDQSTSKKASEVKSSKKKSPSTTKKGTNASPSDRTQNQNQSVPRKGDDPPRRPQHIDDTVEGAWRRLGRLSMHAALNARTNLRINKEALSQARRDAKQSILRDSYFNSYTGAIIQEEKELESSMKLTQAIDTFKERVNQLPRGVGDDESVSSEPRVARMLSTFALLQGDGANGLSPGNMINKDDADDTDTIRTASASRILQDDMQSILSLDTVSEVYSRAESPSVQNSRPDSPASYLSSKQVSSAASIRSLYSATTATTATSATSDTSDGSFVPISPIARARMGKTQNLLVFGGGQNLKKIEQYLQLVATGQKSDTEAVNFLITSQTSDDVTKKGKGKGKKSNRKETENDRTEGIKVVEKKEPFLRVRGPKTRRTRNGIWKFSFPTKTQAEKKVDENALKINLNLRRLKIDTGFGAFGDTNRLYPENYLTKFDLETKEGLRNMMQDMDTQQVRKRREHLPKYLWTTRFMRLQKQVHGRGWGAHSVSFTENKSNSQVTNMGTAADEFMKTIEVENEKQDADTAVNDIDEYGNSDNRENDQVVEAALDATAEDTATNTHTNTQDDDVASEGDNIVKLQQIHGKAPGNKKESVLNRFRNAMTSEVSTSSFLQGKKKNSKTSRFRLYKEQPGDQIPPPEMDRKSKDDLLLNSLKEIHGDETMAHWQVYSIDRTLSNQEGSHITLPSLGGAKNVGKQVRRSKGRYGNRMVYLPGKGDEDFKGVSSYFEIASNMKNGFSSI